MHQKAGKLVILTASSPEINTHCDELLKAIFENILQSMFVLNFDQIYVHQFIHLCVISAACRIISLSISYICFPLQL